jgi:hypothetical protein
MSLESVSPAPAAKSTVGPAPPPARPTVVPPPERDGASKPTWLLDSPGTPRVMEEVESFDAGPPPTPAPMAVQPIPAAQLSRDPTEVCRRPESAAALTCTGV